MVRIGTWNTQWAKPDTPRGSRVSAALAARECDILCVTEGYAKILPIGGHVIDGGSDWGYPPVKWRRKVLLWSKRPWSRPWSDVDPVESDRIPGGRFVAGTTETRAGPLVVIGVCIPWSGARVKGGDAKKKRWQDHESWLVGFKNRHYRAGTKRTVVLGDFNQRVPRKWQPKSVYDLLQSAFEGYQFATEGELVGAPGLSIDHIVHTPDLVPIGDIGIWQKRNAEGKLLSDHFGVWGDFKALSAGSKGGE